MTPRLGTLLDWTVVDVIVLGIAIQQYISISRDLKRTRAAEKAKASAINDGGPASQK